MLWDPQGWQQQQPQQMGQQSMPAQPKPVHNAWSNPQQVDKKFQNQWNTPGFGKPQQTGMVNYQAPPPGAASPAVMQQPQGVPALDPNYRGVDGSIPQQQPWQSQPQGNAWGQQRYQPNPFMQNAQKWWGQGQQQRPQQPIMNLQQLKQQQAMQRSQQPIAKQVDYMPGYGPKDAQPLPGGAGVPVELSTAPHLPDSNSSRGEMAPNGRYYGYGGGPLVAQPINGNSQEFLQQQPQNPQSLQQLLQQLQQINGAGVPGGYGQNLGY
jgi:hypothetical protein